MKKYIIFSIATLFLATSCESDLNVLPREQINEIDFLSNPSNAINMVNGVYAANLKWEMSSFSWIGVTSIVSDDADKGSAPGDSGADKNQLDALNLEPSMLSFNEIWKARYDGIYRANEALHFLPQLTISNDLKNRLIGEVKFLRALWYFDLVRCFGGVPVVTERLDLQNIDAIKNKVFIRKSKDETYQTIIADLLDAVNKLPLTQSDKGRATKGAAQGLLAKVYLYQGKWNDAFQMAGNVIGSGQYALMPNYADVWKEIGENGPESIFEIQATLSLGVGGYAFVQGGRGTPDFGWGFNTPSNSLYNSYENGDLRRDATIMTSGQVLWDGFQTPATWNNPRYNYKVYQSRTQESWNGDNWQQAKNIRVLKFSEILLIRAEAAFRLGNTTEALTHINALRTRAGLAAKTNLTLQDIFKERRAEMAMEHDRWFDIIRTGQATSVMAADGKVFISGKHELFPIPQDQITQSGGLLTQNPGY